jgi:hypothetical protein
VGKPTFATNIEFGFVQMLRAAGTANPRVLLVDTDSQGHPTLVARGRKDYDTHDSLYAAFTSHLHHRNPSLFTYDPVWRQVEPTPAGGQICLPVL